MSLSRVKTWVAEVLTASDLNAEFNNILTYLNATTGTYGGTFGASDGSVGVPGIYFSSDTDNGLYRIGTNNWAASAGGVKGWELDASANFLVPKLLDISGAAAGQVKFPAVQNASSNANTLDDYEEGTWVPVDSSGAALSFIVTSAQYVKTGQMVLVAASVTYPATADGSAAIIGGLPFAAQNTTSSVYGGVPAVNNTTLAITLIVTTNASTIEVVDQTTAAAKTNANLSTKFVRFGLLYRAAA